MALILAIESDRRQANRITAIARERLNVELIVVESTELALSALSERTPDLLLTPQLMLPKDETALNERLRELDTAGSHVQTLMIPVLAGSGRSLTKKDGLLGRFRRGKSEPAGGGDGCDPDVFATQISEYLQRAAEERAAQVMRAEDEQYRQERDQQAVAPLVTEPEAAPEWAPQPETPAQTEVWASQETVNVAADPYSAIAADPAPVEAEQPIFTSESAHVPLVEEPGVGSFLDSMLTSGPSAPADPPDISSIVELEEIEVSQASDNMISFEETIAAVPESVPQQLAPEPVAMPIVPDAFAEFISFDELGVLEAPSVGLGELAAFARGSGASVDFDDYSEELATAPVPRTTNVLDSLELLDGPEISDEIEFPADSREARDRRAAAPTLRDAVDAFLADPTEEPDASDFDFQNDLWTPLPLAAQSRWPRPEGPTVKSALQIPAFDAPPDPGVQFATPQGAERQKKKKGPKPIQDEWGLFDPAQCGFAALLAKLEEVTDHEDSEQPVG